MNEKIMAALDICKRLSREGVPAMLTVHYDEYGDTFICTAFTAGSKLNMGIVEIAGYRTPLTIENLDAAIEKLVGMLNE